MTGMGCTMKAKRIKTLADEIKERLIRLSAEERRWAVGQLLKAIAELGETDSKLLAMCGEVGPSRLTLN